MNNTKAQMFNRKAADPKNKPNQILESLALRPGQKIADIGAGGGYFSLRFAETIGREGKVYVVDTQPEFLDFIRNKVKEKKLDNVELILLDTEDEKDNLNLPPKILPERSLDLIFLRNAYHHLQDRVNYFKNLRPVLKPGGKIAIIEYSGAGSFFSFRKLFGHYVPQEKIIKEMKEAGFSVKESFDFLLPEQSFTIFRM